MIAVPAVGHLHDQRFFSIAHHWVVLQPLRGVHNSSYKVVLKLNPTQKNQRRKKMPVRRSRGGPILFELDCDQVPSHVPSHLHGS